MSRRPLTLSSFVCAAALAAPALTAADAGAATYPHISSVKPMHVAVGQKLTIRGTGFRTGTGRNTVIFRSPHGRAVFVRSARSSSRSVSVVVSSKLRRYMPLSGGHAVPTRFSLNVLASRLGTRFTSRSLSPVVSEASGTPAGVAGSACDPRSRSWDPNADTDHDLLTNGFEKSIATDPCVYDTDGDGVSDGYEYASALDLNRQPINHLLVVDTTRLPYPGKRPYPNALDPSDASNDHDGDGLTLSDEYHAWMKYGDRSALYPSNGKGLLYSDGTQNSGGSAITDDRKDADNDGLPNWVEAHGPGLPAWWNETYKDEPAYDYRAWNAPNWLDADTDGDGVKDGADDSDHDGWSDESEMGLGTVYSPRAISQLWVQPFNPCLPDPESPTCSLHPPITDPWEPFKSHWPVGWTAGQGAPAGFTAPPLAWPRPTVTSGP